MANRKVGVYRKYLEAVPVDLSGLPKAAGPRSGPFAGWPAGFPARVKGPVEVLGPKDRPSHSQPKKKSRFKMPRPRD